jgi:hypothetical protein
MLPAESVAKDKNLFFEVSANLLGSMRMISFCLLAQGRLQTNESKLFL